MSDGDTDFDHYFGPKAVVIDLRATSPEEAVDELIDALVASQKIDAQHRDAIARSIKTRNLSVNCEHEIGLLLGSSNLMGQLELAFGRSRQGIRFNTTDGQPVWAVLMCLIPQGRHQEHVQTMANFLKLMPRRDFREWLK